MSALAARARALRKAAIALAAAVEQGEPESLEAALSVRETAFEQLLEGAGDGLDAKSRPIVEEVIALDARIQQRLREQQAAIRAELDQIAHTRRVVARETADDVPRFVSRRA